MGLNSTVAEVRSVSGIRTEFTVTDGTAFNADLGGGRPSEVIHHLSAHPSKLSTDILLRKMHPILAVCYLSPRNITHLWDGQDGVRRPIKAAGDHHTLSPSTCLFPFRGQIAKHEQDRVKSSSMNQRSHLIVRITRASLFSKTQNRPVHKERDELLGFGLFIFGCALQFQLPFSGLDQFSLAELHDGLSAVV